MKLTQAFVKRAKCDADKQKQCFSDDTLKGFVLEVRSNGRKTFYLRSTTIDNKRKSTKIGDATILPTEVARTKAIKLKRSLEQGKDVIIDTPVQTQTSITLQEFYKQYYLPYIQKHVPSWKSSDSIFRIHILPIFGKYKMNEIKKHTIMKAHIDMIHKKNCKPATANKLLIFLSQAYKIAQELELDGIEENPARKVKLLENKKWGQELFLAFSLFLLKL